MLLILFHLVISLHTAVLMLLIQEELSNFRFTPVICLEAARDKESRNKSC